MRVYPCHVLNALRKKITTVLERPLDRYVERRLLRGSTTFGDRGRVRLHPSVTPYGVHFNTTSGTITVEKDAFFGNGAMLLTGTHDVAKFGPKRRTAVPTSGRDITVREGAWISAGAIVLGPCCVGEHSVVAAGAVVTKDVAPYTVVAGVPATTIRALEPTYPDKPSSGQT